MWMFLMFRVDAYYSLSIICWISLCRDIIIKGILVSRKSITGFAVYFNWIWDASVSFLVANCGGGFLVLNLCVYVINPFSNNFILQIFEKNPTKIKNYGIWLRYQSRTGYHNMYKEYRDTTLNGSVEAMYNEMASRHRVRSPCIQIIKTAK